MPHIRHSVLMVICTLAAAPLQSASAATQPDTTDIIYRQAREFMSVTPVFERIYTNPAMTGLRRAGSYSSVGISWRHTEAHNGKPYNPAMGTAENRGTFMADAYIRQGSSTLTGFAGYATGKIKSMQWCETSDYDMVYPYVLADDTGGDLNEEIYRFGGGISSQAGRWRYGASLAYKAGLYYRNVDPRPRNVTGLLNLSAGIGYTIGRHIMALAVRADKYKQTNSIEFMSESGSAKIYHLTGLGTDYVRFAGSGESTYYSGWRRGASFDMHPAHGACGLTARLEISRFTFTNIISDLNKLPMAKVRETVCSAEAGWKSHSVAVNAFADITRRLGDENIFGDPQSGSYPQIATLTMYARNHVRAGADMAATVLSGSRAALKITAQGAYTHDNQVLASDPARRTVNNVHMKLGCSATYRACASTLMSAEAAYCRRHSVGSRFDRPDTGAAGAIATAYSRFMADSHNIDCASGTVALTRALPQNLALNISVSGTVTTIASHCAVSASIIF